MAEPTDLLIRPLTRADLYAGVLDILAGLTVVDLTPVQAETLLPELERTGTRTLVAERAGQVVGVASLLVEQKLIHSGGRIGHIEDVAVRASCRGQGFGTALIRHAVAQAKELGCYKVILNCAAANVAFYQSLGFRAHETSMRMDLDRA